LEGKGDSVGKSKEKEVDKRTALEKMQDLSRDIFVSLFILVILVIPTTYIGVRSFQPMTVPGYEKNTFANFLVDQFENHLAYEAQTIVFLEVLVSPYSAAIDLAKNIFPNLDKRETIQTSGISWKKVPDSWWLAIQEKCIYWLKKGHGR
jgi:hypothetical protein